MHHTIDTETDAPKRYQCRHIFTDGHRCGSPCLRGEHLCYYHHTTRKPAPRTHGSSFELPLPEDRSAIQASIGQVLQRIAANDIDPRRAGLLLYGLQIASLNLPKPPAHRNAKPEPIEIVEEITTDPQLGALAPRAEVGKFTERKSRVGLLIEKIMQEDKRRQQDQPQPATLPTLQAAEAIPAIQSCATNSSRPQAEPAPARQLGSLPARPRPVHPTRRAEQPSPQPPSAPTYAGHTDTPQSQHSAPDRQSDMPLPHSPAAQTTSHRPPLHRSARAHTHPSPPDGDAGSQPSPPT